MPHPKKKKNMNKTNRLGEWNRMGKIGFAFKIFENFLSSLFQISENFPQKVVEF